MAPVGIVREFDKAFDKSSTSRLRKTARSLQQNFDGFEGLRAPKVYDEFCAVGVLIGTHQRRPNHRAVEAMAPTLTR